MKFNGKNEVRQQPGSCKFENGINLWDAGRIEEAIAEFSAAGREGFRTDAIENNLGAGSERLGQIDEALAHYAAALKYNPSNFFALKNMAEILSSKGEWVEARKYFVKALRADPNDSAIRLDYIRSLIASGAFAKAKKEITSLFEKNADPRMIINAMSILRDAEAFEDIVELSALSSPALQESSDFLRMAGEACLETGMTKEAVSFFNKAMSKDGDAVTKSWLGLAELTQENDERGLMLLRESLAEDGDDLQILRNLSFALHGEDRLEEALSVYERAVKLYPDEFVMWNNWGNALYNLQRYAESIPKFVVAIEKNQDYEIAWNNIGNALEKMKLYKESLPFHVRAIEINEEFDYAHYAAAVALLMVGKYKEAMAELNRSLISNPIFPDAWDLKARSLIGRAPEVGVAFAERAIETEPDLARPLITLAMCQMMAGMNADAERNLRIAHRIATLGGEQLHLREIQDLEESGIPAISRIIASDGLRMDKGAQVETAASDVDQAFNLYRLGSEQMSKGKMERSASLYSIAFEIDGDSSAIAYALLKSEMNKERLRKYLEESRRISSSGLSTPSLAKAIDEVAKKLDYAVLDRAMKDK